MSDHNFPDSGALALAFNDAPGRVRAILRAMNVLPRAGRPTMTKASLRGRLGDTTGQREESTEERTYYLLGPSAACTSTGQGPPTTAAP